MELLSGLWVRHAAAWDLSEPKAPLTGPQDAVFGFGVRDRQHATAYPPPNPTAKTLHP